MSDAKRCKRCGGPLLSQPSVVGEHCPRCMVKFGLQSTIDLGEPDVSVSDEGNWSTGLHPRTIGRYKILRVIGEGGMGIVYEAEQEQPQRKVALKIIKPGLSDSEVLRRFEQEALALGRLQHPGIAQIYEAGTADTGLGLQPYFAMELIQGRMLLDYVREQKPKIPERLELVAKIADAVHHAHQRGLIHRDLKPNNIIVDESSQPKVLDFGVTRIIDSEIQATLQTNMGQIVGTLSYMSPEQVMGDPLEIDIRSDVYALGIILYEVLTDHLPYNTNVKLHKAIRVIQEEEPMHLGTLNRLYKGDIDTISIKALEKDKERRYTSAAEFASDIRRFLKNEPIIAKPQSAKYYIQKFAKRHRALVLGIAAVFVVLIAGIVVSNWQATRARRAEQSAVLERDRARQAEIKAGIERDRATAAEEYANVQRDSALVAEQQAKSERNRAVAAEKQAQKDRDRLIWRSLVRESIRISSSRSDDDLAALLARQAMLFHMRSTPDEPRYLVEDALQKAIRPDRWSHVLLKGGTQRFTSVVFSPNGTHLAASGDFNSVVRVWDFSKPLASARLIPVQGSRTIAFSPDGRHLATCGDAVRIWDMDNVDTNPLLLKGTPRSVHSVAFSPSGKYLAAAGSDKTIRVWNLSKPDAAILLFDGPGNSLSYVAFSADGKRLASGDMDGYVRLWDIDNPEASPLLLTTDWKMTGSIGSGSPAVAFSPDGEYLAAGCGNNIVRLWKVSDLSNPWMDLNNPDASGDIVFSADSRYLALACGNVRIWDLDNPKTDPLILEGYARSVSFSPDGRNLATDGSDNSVRVWELSKHDVPLILSPSTFGPVETNLNLRLHKYADSSLKFSPDSARLASGGSDPNVRVWDLSNPNSPPLVLQGKEGRVLSVSFSPDGKRLASGGTDTIVRVWDVQNPKKQPLRLQGHLGAVLAVSFSPDGIHLFSAGSNANVQLWNLQNPPESTLLFKNQDRLRSAAFSPDFSLLAAINQISDQTVPVMDGSGAVLGRTENISTRTVKVINLHNSPSPSVILEETPSNIAIMSLVFSPDGKQLAYAGIRPEVKIWNLDNLKSTPLLQDQPRSRIRSTLAFSPDLYRLAYGPDGDDGSVLLWDLKETAEPPIRLEGSDEYSTSLAFSPDGTYLASLNSETGHVQVWRLWAGAAADLCKRVWRNLTMDEWNRYVGENIPYECTCPELPPGIGAPN